MEDSGLGNEGFQVLLRRVRAGDEQAARELVRRYEPAIRRAARIRLVDTRLNRLLDSMDICQSVLASSTSAPPWTVRAGDARAVAQAARDDDKEQAG